MEPVYTPVIGFARALFAAQGLKFTISGAEHVPAHGGAVMAMNHLSYFDYAYAGLPARDHKRLVRWMAKKEIFDHPVMGPLMRGMKHIPVDRAAGSAAYDEAVQALRDGKIVGVFPETTISRSYELREFKTGAVRMAQEAGVPRCRRSPGATTASGPRTTPSSSVARTPPSRWPSGSRCTSRPMPTRSRRRPGCAPSWRRCCTRRRTPIRSCAATT